MFCKRDIIQKTVDSFKCNKIIGSKQVLMNNDNNNYNSNHSYNSTSVKSDITNSNNQSNNN